MIEALLAIGLGAAFLGLAAEALRFFTVRGAMATEEAARAQELGLMVERLRRVLKLAAQVEPTEDGFVVYRARWGEGGPCLDRVLVVRAVGDEILVREEGAVRGAGGAPGQPEQRYRVGPEAGGSLGAREVDGAIAVRLGGELGLEVRVRPAQVAEGPLVLPPGTKADLDGLYARMGDDGWASREPLAGVGPAGAGASGVVRGFAARGGTVPGPSGPVRSSLYAELSALGPEVSALGAALLPVPALGAEPRVDAWDATQKLMAEGWNAEDASLLAVYLAGMEMPHRFVRAAALASLEGRLAGMDTAAKIELIASLHPPMVERADPDRLAGAAGGIALVAPGSLVQGMAPAEGGRGRDLPQGFGSVEDSTGAGRPPDWNDWESSLGGVPPELAAGLRRPGAAPLPAGTDPAPEPEVGVPVALFPPPPRGAGGDESASQPVARTPDLGAAASDFDAAQGNLDAKQVALAQQTQAYQQAQAELNAREADLAQARALLEERQARLDGLNRQAADGSCTCPETKALIEESKAEIDKLEGQVKSARTRTQREATRLTQATSARDQAQVERDAAAAVFEAEADAVKGP